MGGALGAPTLRIPERDGTLRAPDRSWQGGALVPEPLGKRLPLALHRPAVHPKVGAAGGRLGHGERDGAAGQGAETEEDDPWILAGRRGVRCGRPLWKGP